MRDRWEGRGHTDSQYWPSDRERDRKEWSSFEGSRWEGRQQSYHDQHGWKDSHNGWSSKGSHADFSRNGRWHDEDSGSLTPIDWDRVPRDSFKRCFLTPDRVCVSGESEEPAAKRRALGIVVEEYPESVVPKPVQTFDELGVLPDYVLEALRKQGIQAPMPIQAQALPFVLAGHNVVGIAETGSGKTLAFLLPAIVHMEAQEPLATHDATPIALVMAPTRELVVQIAEEATKIVGGRHGLDAITIACLYGGGNRRDQKWSCSGAHLAVASPGRLIDFVKSRILSLSRVTYFVLDEADRMLDMGFHGDVEQIGWQIRPERQVLFFSATWSDQVQKLARGLCLSDSGLARLAYRGRSATTKSTENIGGDAIEDTTVSTDSTKLRAKDGITQEVIVVDCLTGDPPQTDWDEQAKRKGKLLDSHIRKVLTQSDDHKILVFVSQKGLADNLSKSLQDDGFYAEAMHGGLDQASRLHALEQFKTGALKLLVVTDVLQRGIDIPQVSHVVIHGMGSVDGYIHRIGRTARGREKIGHALLFFEYNPLYPNCAAELIEVLEASSQCVPDELRQIAREVEAGNREIKQTSKKAKWKASDTSWHNRGGW